MHVLYQQPRPLILGHCASTQSFILLLRVFLSSHRLNLAKDIRLLNLTTSQICTKNFAANPIENWAALWSPLQQWTRLHGRPFCACFCKVYLDHNSAAYPRTRQSSSGGEWTGVDTGRGGEKNGSMEAAGSPIPSS